MQAEWGLAESDERLAPSGRLASEHLKDDMLPGDALPSSRVITTARGAV